MKTDRNMAKRDAFSTFVASQDQTQVESMNAARKSRKVIDAVQAADANVDIPSQTSTRFHESHLITNIGGFFVCQRCGFRSSGEKPQGLARECPKTFGGRAKDFRRLKEGKLPSGVKHWPKDIL